MKIQVCNNFQLHLRGNVYVQYSNEDEAKWAIENIRGRWYAGKQLICDYCPVTKWKPAICGNYILLYYSSLWSVILNLCYFRLL
jgi:hypothetical protein